MDTKPAATLSVGIDPDPQVRWTHLTNHLRKWYYEPDLDALAITLAAACSLNCADRDPIWLFVIGPSSSGKTAIIINSLRGLPHAIVLGALTRKTLLSHHDGGKSSLLNRTGRKGLWLFKDFTTFLSMREEDRAEITSQLREIYDGEFSAHCGVPGIESWRGNIGVIGVCTSSFERAWAFRRDMGERFLQIRWNRSGSIEMAKAAARQRGREEEITLNTTRLASEFCQTSRLKPAQPLSVKDSNHLAYLSEIVVRARASVIRDTHGAREIIDIPHPEESPRMHKALEMLVTTHMQLFGRTSPNAADLKVAQRVGFDSIPAIRSAILRHIPEGAAIVSTELSRLTRIPVTTIAWNAEELKAHGLILEERDLVGATCYSFSPEYMSLLESSRGE